MAKRAENPHVLDAAAPAVHGLGHAPVVGVNMVLPVVAAAGDDDAAYDDIMTPASLALADRCDACLRSGGPSKGADDEVHRFVAAGRPVFRSLNEIPEAGRP